jgi:hypothetical protein
MKIAWFIFVISSLLPRLVFPQSNDTAQSERPQATSKAPGDPVSQTTVVKPESSASAQRFECSAGFTLDDCKQEMKVLIEVLQRYQANRLGEWKWVLVRSEDWSHVLLARGISTSVPAITILPARTTLFDEALVSGPTGRVSELMDTWHLDRSALLDLAVRHELGHALCNDHSERNAERVANQLEQNKAVSCEKTGSGSRSAPRNR